MPTCHPKDRPQCGYPGCDSPVTWVKKYSEERVLYRYVCEAHHRKSWHPSLKHRKDYCENRDGRLGYTCTTNVIWTGMLDVDHINGDPSDNRFENFQTLCKCCHAYKTHRNRDSRTPGRKTLKQQSMNNLFADLFA